MVPQFLLCLLLLAFLSTCSAFMGSPFGMGGAGQSTDPDDYGIHKMPGFEALDPRKNPARKERRALQDAVDTIKIGLINFEPMTECTVSEDPVIGEYDEATNPTGPDGYSIDVLLLVLTEIGQDTATREYYCYDSVDSLTFALLANEVDIGEASIHIDYDLIERGLQFAQPNYNSGLKMVIRKISIRDWWSFVQPISVELGVTFLAATVVNAMFVFFYEEKNWRRPMREHVMNFVEVLYDSFSSYFSTNAIELRHGHARVVQWFFWFVVIILIAIYQADLTGKLSSAYFQKDFSDFREGIAVEASFLSFSEYKDYIEQEAIILAELETDVQYDSALNLFTYTPLASDTKEVMDDMYGKLLDEDVDCIIIDAPLADYWTQWHCGTFAIDDIIVQFNYGTAFAPEGVLTSDSIIDAYSEAITKLKELHSLRLLKKQHFDMVITDEDCDDEEVKISMKELAGLWIVLAIAIGVSLLLFLIKKLGFVKFPSNYMSPYYNYFNDKTEAFEKQLTDAVEHEVKKILNTYQDQLLHEINSFERCLMLQDDLDKKTEDIFGIEDKRRLAKMANDSQSMADFDMASSGGFSSMNQFEESSSPQSRAK